MEVAVLFLGTSVWWLLLSLMLRSQIAEWVPAGGPWPCLNEKNPGFFIYPCEAQSMHLQHETKMRSLDRAGSKTLAKRFAAQTSAAMLLQRGPSFKKRSTTSRSVKVPRPNMGSSLN